MQAEEVGAVQADVVEQEEGMEAVEELEIEEPEDNLKNRRKF